MKTIFIEPDGSVSFLGDECPVDLPLGNPIRKRVSVIQPAHNVWKRIAFKILRTVFAEQGRVSDWTRTWQCEWRATILATGQSAVFENRQAAVDWEYEILTGPKFDL